MGSSGDSPAPTDASTAVQWDWNQFSSLWHSQFSSSGAEPLTTCLRPLGRGGGGHLPWPVGRQGQRGGNKEPLVQTLPRRAPSLPEPAGIGATPPPPALSSPWWGGLCPQATALAAACKSQQGKAAAPPKPHTLPTPSPPTPKTPTQHSAEASAAAQEGWGGGTGLGAARGQGDGWEAGWEQEGGTPGRAHSGADKV